MGFSSSTCILLLKIVLISTGIVSIATFMTSYVNPIFMEFANNQIPLIWSALITFLAPPYLYLLINAIILAILASSLFHHNYSDSQPLDIHSESYPPSDFAPVPGPVISEVGVVESPVMYEADETVDVKKPVVVNGFKVGGDDEDDENDYVLNSPEFGDTSMEKPLISTRISHRKPFTSSSKGGKALQSVAKRKKHETLESTWKAISHHTPLTRDITRSDTFENSDKYDSKKMNFSPEDHPKSKLFEDRTNYEIEPFSRSSKSSKILRKESSLSQEELNRRSEAFIQKIKEDMRLQKQESLNQYLEMINRGEIQYQN